MRESSALKRFMALVAFGVLFVVPGESAFGDAVHEKLVPTSRLKKYVPEQVEPGFTLYPEESTASVHLLNIQGEVVHSWSVDADRARLLPNCNILVVHGTKWGAKREPWRSLRAVVREYSWDGEVVWEYKARDVIHHDARRMADGSTLFLKRTVVPEEYQLRIEDSVRRMTKIRSDSILSVDPAGKIQWRWNAHEHLDLNFPGAGGWTRYTSPNGARFRMQDWTHINTVSPLPENRWYDEGDERFKPGNILFQARNWSTTFLISRQTGEVLWRYQGDFQGGVTGGHEPHMIPKGMPGAGNILLFDNGRITHNNHSLILEIDPISKEVVWSYGADDFYSEAAGSAQRLSNGNTLISEDRRGRVFEVTREGEIVWDYQGGNQSNRASRYKPDYCSEFMTSGKSHVKSSWSEFWSWMLS